MRTVKNRDLLRSTFAVLTSWLLSSALNVQSASLNDFGYQNRRVNGVLPQGGRPLLVILADFDTGPAFTKTPAYFTNLVFNWLNPKSVNGFFLAISNGRFY